jgi:multiple sugar transport system permease protein
MENNVTQLDIKKPLTYQDANLGTLNEGYNEEQNVNLHYVSRKERKKEYVVGGVSDQEQSNNWKGWLYLAPVLILMSVFLIYPLINTIAISFMKDYNYATGSFNGFTFDNYLIILGLKEISAGVYETDVINYALPNTFLIVFVTVPLSIIIALLISVLLNNLKWLQKVYQVIFFLPYVTNTIAVGMVFSVLFDKTGVINYIFGSNITWIYGANRWTAMIPLCIYIVWGSLPFKILILLSGLQNVDKQYYQAAKIDSASSMKILWRITVPSLSPQILYLMVTSFIGAFKEYTAVVGLFNGPSTTGTGGTPEMLTMVFYIYKQLNSQPGRAAACAVLLFLIILCFTFLQLYLSKRKARN